jgi:hypothetical protein
MPPLLAVALATSAAAIGARWVQREWRRVNEALDRADAAARTPARADDLPTLRRDPKTGVWRPS